VHARGLVADEQLAADLAVGQPVAEQGENLDLARRELELLQPSIRCRVETVARAEVDPGTACQGFELFSERPRAELVSDLVRRLHERCRAGAVAARAEQRFGSSPLGVGGVVPISLLVSTTAE
jgi:hypothetical protein